MTLLNIGRKTIIFLYNMHDTEWLLAMFHHKNENIIGKGIFSLVLSWILDHIVRIKWNTICKNTFV